MVLSLGSDTRAWALALCAPPSPMCTSMWATSQVEVLFRNKLCGESSSFHLQAPVAAFLSDVLKLPLPPMSGFSNVWNLFLLHNLLLRVQITIPKSFVSFFPLSSALPHSEETGLHFWKSSTFASIQKMLCRSWSAWRWTFYVFVCGEGSPCLIPQPSWKSSQRYFCLLWL